MVSAEKKHLFEFFEHFEIVNIYGSIVTNLLLIYLIIFRSSQEIGAYRYLLLGFALNDINFPIAHYLARPIICTYKDAFIMFSHGIFTSRLSICLFACTLPPTMPLLAHLFVYRLIATKWPWRLGFYTIKTCFLLLFFSVGTVSSLWFIICYVPYAPDKELTNHVQDFLVKEFDGEGQGFIGALFYGSKGELRARDFTATMGFNAIMTVCVSVILFCVVAIISHFRTKQIETSGMTKKIQQILLHIVHPGWYIYCDYTVLMILSVLLPHQTKVQMMVPMIFVYLPCAVILNLPIFGFRLNVFPNLISASITIFPLFDALVVMIGVRSYRRTIISVFKFNNNSSAPSIFSSNSNKLKPAVLRVT